MAFYFFILHLFHKKVVVRDLTSFYLLPDFIYIVLLPLSILLKAVLPGNTWIYSLIYTILLALNILLKLKAIGLASSLSMGKSFLLFLTPWVLSFFFIGINIFYFIFKAISAFL